MRAISFGILVVWLYAGVVTLFAKIIFALLFQTDAVKEYSVTALVPELLYVLIVLIIGRYFRAFIRNSEFLLTKLSKKILLFVVGLVTLVCLAPFPTMAYLELRYFIQLPDFLTYVPISSDPDFLETYINAALLAAFFLVVFVKIQKFPIHAGSGEPSKETAPKNTKPLKETSRTSGDSHTLAYKLGHFIGHVQDKVFNNIAETMGRHVGRYVKWARANRLRNAFLSLIVAFLAYQVGFYAFNLLSGSGATSSYNSGSSASNSDCILFANALYTERLEQAIADPSLWQLGGYESARDFAETSRRGALMRCKSRSGKD